VSPGARQAFAHKVAATRQQLAAAALVQSTNVQ
jgi:hypothetical protein